MEEEKTTKGVTYNSPENIYLQEIRKKNIHYFLVYLFYITLAGIFLWQTIITEKQEFKTTMKIIELENQIEKINPVVEFPNGQKARLQEIMIFLLKQQKIIK